MDNRGGGGLIAVDATTSSSVRRASARLALGVTRDVLKKPLPAADLLGGTSSPARDLDQAERGAVQRALARSDGNVSAAAEALGISRATLHRKLRAPRASSRRTERFVRSDCRSSATHAPAIRIPHGLTAKPAFAMVFPSAASSDALARNSHEQGRIFTHCQGPVRKRDTATSSAANGPSRARAAISRTSRRSTAGCCARSHAPTPSDVEAALDAAHAAKDAWGRTSVAERALILNRIADRMEENLDLLALAETWDNGKPIRETTAADVPLAIDHFRYFAGAIRAQEGGLSEIDHDTVAYHFHEPLGVVGQIIPWNFPLLMACWKLAPALAAGNCVVLKPAEQTPAAIMVWADLIGDLLPPGVLNIVNGFGLEAGKPLASSPRIAKIAFTGETTTGRLIMQYASQNLIPVTLELGGKSPNIFFEDVIAEDDDFFDKAIEGFVMFAFNQGEVCTCPSRALIHESIYDRFMERALKRVEAIVQGDPLDPATMIGAQASSEQMREDPVLYRHRPRGGRARC